MAGTPGGDINGDGIDDIVAAAPRQDSPRGIEEVGAVALILGGAAFRDHARLYEAFDGGADATFFGVGAQDYAGEKLAVGDLDGDGKADLAIGAQQANDRGDPSSDEKNATIYIVYGSDEFTGNIDLGNANAVIARKDSMHVAAMTIGDVNNDGYADLIFSDILTDDVKFPPVAPLVDGEKRGINGAVYIFYGGKTRLEGNLDPATDADVILMKAGGADMFQVFSIAVGDIDKSGKNDLALGLPVEDGQLAGLDEAGQVQLWIDATRGGPDCTIYGGKKSDQIGGALAIGDIDGDGASDLIIGAPDALGPADASGAGMVQTVFGRAVWPDDLDLFEDADITFDLGEKARMGFKTGKALAVSDFNGDGIDDLAISSPRAFNTSGDNGWIHIVAGQRSFPGTVDLEKQADLIIRAPEAQPAPADPLASGQLGETLAAGDFDADGVIDMIAGAPMGVGNISGAKTNAGWTAVFLAPIGNSLLFGADACIDMPAVDVLGRVYHIKLCWQADLDFALDLDSIGPGDLDFTPVIALEPESDYGLCLPSVEIIGVEARYAFELTLTDVNAYIWSLDLGSFLIK